MRTRNFLRSCWHGLVGRAPAYLFGAVFTAGLAFSLTTYAVHDINVFELDNGTTGANAIDEPTNAGPPSGAADWAQNNFPNTLNNCPDGVNSCGYVSGPNVDEANPGGGAFRSLFIPDPNGASGDSVFAGGGSKDDLDVSKWKWKTDATSSDKTDLLPVGAAAYLNGDLLIYTFGTLFAPNGNAAIGTWLFKNNIGLCGASKPSGAPFGVGQEVVDPITNVSTFVCDAVQPPNLHENGDVLVQSDNTNGGRDVEMRIYKWVGNYATSDEKQANCSGTVINGTLCLIAEEEDAACSDDLDDDNFCGNMNLDGVPTESPDDWGYLAKGNEQPKVGPASPTGTDGIAFDDFPPTTLFEAGFNFSKLFPNEVGCFNTFLMSTRSSQSVDAVLEDFASGAFPLCGISVEKTGDTLGKVGDPVDYTITVTNTGAIIQNRVSIIDTVLGDLADAANPYVTSSTCGATLAAGASCVIEATRTVLANDPDPLPNTVEVVYSAGGDESTAEASHSVNLFQPAVSVDKTGDTLSKVGDPVNYTIVVTNDSSDDSPDLVNGTIQDTLLGNLLDPANPYVTSSTCSATLATDATPTSCTISATRTVQAGDADPLPNTVTVHYNPEGFPNDISANDIHIVELFQPSVTIDKTGDTLSKVTDSVNYTITVNNTSSPDSPDLVCDITDTLLGTLAEDVNLESGSDPYVINTSRTVQEGDPDPLVNTATVTCSPVGFPNELTDSDDHSVNLFQPSIVLVKTGDELSKVGDDVTYTITLTNTSSADTPDLDCTVSDLKLGLVKQVLNLASGNNDVTNVPYIVLAGDTDPLLNTAGATCSPQGFPNVLQAGDGHSINLFQPSVTIDKDANCELGVVVGEDITYTYTITNTGSPDSPDLVLASISDTVLDDLAADAILAGCDSLVSGASCQFTKVQSTSVVTPDPLTNTVDVLYHPAGFPNNVEASATESCDLVPPEPARVVIEKVLLNGEGQEFGYNLVNIFSIPLNAPVPHLDLTPLIGQVPLAQSPFDDQPVGASNGFATTGLAELEVKIPDITQAEQASVTEVLPLPAFFNFVGLECRAAEGGALTGVDYSGGDLETATLTLRSGDFAFCRYVNAFNPGDEGCTPGFWKQDFHFGHWPDPYEPIDHDGLLATELQEVFIFPANGNGPRADVHALGSDTMLEALFYPKAEKVSKLASAAQTLLRAAVAAVLNAKHSGVQFAFTEDQVKALVSIQLQTGTSASILALATELDQANNGVLIDNENTADCPLSGQLFLQ